MFDKQTALDLAKARLNRLPVDTSLDAYLAARIDAAVGEITGKGINLTGDTDDTLLVVDYAVFQYGARDNQNGLPEWLRQRIRERWLRERRPTDAP